MIGFQKEIFVVVVIDIELVTRQRSVYLHWKIDVILLTL